MLEDLLRLDKYRRKLVFYQSGAIGSMIFPITVAYYMGARLLFGWNIYIAGILAGLTGTFWASNSYAMKVNIDRILKKKNYTDDEYLKERDRYRHRPLIALLFLIIEAILIILFKI